MKDKNRKKMFRKLTLILTLVMALRGSRTLKKTSKYWREGVKLPNFERISKMENPKINLIELLKNTLKIETEVDGNNEIFSPEFSKIITKLKKPTIQNFIPEEKIDFSKCKKIFNILPSKFKHALLCGEKSTDLVIIDHNPKTLEKVQIITRHKFEDQEYCGAVNSISGINEHSVLVEKIYVICKRKIDQKKFISVHHLIMNGDKLYKTKVKEIEEKSDIGENFELIFSTKDYVRFKEFEFILWTNCSGKFVGYRIQNIMDEIDFEFIDLKSKFYKNWPIKNNQELVNFSVIGEYKFISFKEKSEDGKKIKVFLSVFHWLMLKKEVQFSKPLLMYETENLDFEKNMKIVISKEILFSKEIDFFQFVILTEEKKIKICEFDIYQTITPRISILKGENYLFEIENLMEKVEKIFIENKKIIFFGNGKIQVFFGKTEALSKAEEIQVTNPERILLQNNKADPKKLILFNFKLQPDEIVEFYSIEDLFITFPGLKKIKEDPEKKFEGGIVRLKARTKNTEEYEIREVKFRVLTSKYGVNILNARTQFYEDYTKKNLRIDSWKGDFEGNDKSFQATLTKKKSKKDKKILKTEKKIQADVSYTGNFKLQPIPKEKFEFKEINNIVSKSSNSFTLEDKSTIYFYECYEEDNNTKNRAFCSKKIEISKKTIEKILLPNSEMIDSSYFENDTGTVFMNCYRKIGKLSLGEEKKSFLMFNVQYKQGQHKRNQFFIRSLKYYIDDCSVNYDSKGKFTIYAGFRKNSLKQDKSEIEIKNAINGLIVVELSEDRPVDMLKFVPKVIRNIEKVEICPYRVKAVRDKIVVLSKCAFKQNDNGLKMESSSILVMKHPKNFQFSNLKEIAKLLILKKISLENWVEPDVCVTKDHVHVFEKGDLENRKILVESYSIEGVDESGKTLLDGTSRLNIKKIIDFTCDVKRSSFSILAEKKNNQKILVNFDAGEITNANNRFHSVQEVKSNVDKIEAIHLSNSDKMVSITYQKKENDLEGYYFDLDGPSFKFPPIKEAGDYELDIEYSGLERKNILRKKSVLKLEEFSMTGKIELKKALKKREIKENKKFNIGEFMDFKGAVFDIEYKGTNPKNNTMVELIEENKKFWNFDFSSYSSYNLVQFDILEDYAITVLECQEEGKGEVEIILHKEKKNPKKIFEIKKRFIKVLKAEIVATPDKSVFIFLISKNRINNDNFLTVIHKTKKGEWSFTEYRDKEKKHLEFGMEKVEFYHMANEPFTTKEKLKFSMIWIDNEKIPHIAYTNLHLNFNREPAQIEFFSEKKEIYFDKVIHDFSVSYSQKITPDKVEKNLKQFDVAGAILTLVIGNEREVRFLALTLDNEGLLEFKGDKYMAKAPVMNEVKEGGYSFRNSKMHCNKHLTQVVKGKRGYQNFCFLGLRGKFSLSFYVKFDLVNEIEKNGLMVLKIEFERKYQNLLNYYPLRVVRNYDTMLGVFQRSQGAEKIEKSEILNDQFLVIIWREYESKGPVGILTGMELGGGVGNDINLEVLRVFDKKEDIPEVVLFINRHSLLSSSQTKKNGILIENDYKKKISSFSLNIGYRFDIKDFKSISVSQDEFAIKSYHDEKILVKLGDFFSAKFDNGRKKDDQKKSSVLRWVILGVLILSVIFLITFYYVAKKKKRNVLFYVENSMEVEDEMMLSESDYSRL